MQQIFKVRCKGSHGRCKCDSLCEYWTTTQPNFGKTLIHTLEVKDGVDLEKTINILNENEGR